MEFFWTCLLGGFAAGLGYRFAYALDVIAAAILLWAAGKMRR